MTPKRKEKKGSLSRLKMDVLTSIVALAGTFIGNVLGGLLHSYTLGK